MKKGGGVVDDLKVMFTRKDSSCLARGVMFLVIFAVGIVAGLWTAAGPRTLHHMPYSSIVFPSTVVYADGDNGAGGFAEFVAPTRLMHDMTDEQLFWRASMVPVPAGARLRIAIRRSRSSFGSNGLAR